MLREYRTPRLVVRGWTPEDAAARKRAVDANLDRLRPWFPWAAADPRPLDEHVRLIDAQRADFAAGRWWSYGAWRTDAATSGDGPTLVGAFGVYRARQDSARPSTRELSYWLTAEATGQGIATEAVGALAAAALAEPGVLSLEIRVDSANEPSARVPPRLGFTLRERLVGDRIGLDAQPLDTLVWERRQTPIHLRPATLADVPRLHTIRAAARDAHPANVRSHDPTHDVAAVTRGVCWVWADDGVRGFAAGHPAGHPEVWDVCVDPPAQRRGLGQALLAQITDVLWARGHRRLTAGAPAGSRAERLCRAAGWSAAGVAANGDLLLRRDL